MSRTPSYTSLDKAGKLDSVELSPLHKSESSTKAKEAAHGAGGHDDHGVSKIASKNCPS